MANKTRAKKNERVIWAEIEYSIELHGQNIGDDIESKRKHMHKLSTK